MQPASSTVGDYTLLSNKPTIPTSITDLGITDGTTGQVLQTDGAGTFSFTTVATAGIIGSFTFTGTNIDTDDSSGITVTPPLTANSDLTVQNDLNVVNDVFAKNFISTGTGSPEFDSSSKITFTAPDGVVVNLGALRLANFNNAQRDAYSADNGDMIYNTQDNKIQAYINGAWRRIDDSAIV